MDICVGKYYVRYHENIVLGNGAMVIFHKNIFLGLGLSIIEITLIYLYRTSWKLDRYCSHVRENQHKSIDHFEILREYKRNGEKEF